MEFLCSLQHLTNLIILSLHHVFILILKGLWVANVFTSSVCIWLLLYVTPEIILFCCAVLSVAVGLQHGWSSVKQSHSAYGLNAFSCCMLSLKCHLFCIDCNMPYLELCCPLRKEILLPTGRVKMSTFRFFPLPPFFCFWFEFCKVFCNDNHICH